MYKMIQIFIELIFLASMNKLIHALNSTGGVSPTNVYQEADFAYYVIDSLTLVPYQPLGSTTGKCNVMGYWHTGNAGQPGAPSAEVLERDTLICTDKCTVATCGFSSALTPRPDAAYRNPLVDYGGTDSIFSAADYKAFPDLVSYPSMGGGIVPVFNIPELLSDSYTLVLSRSTIANIFLGNIRYWNDSRILADNTGEVQEILSKINRGITFVVRTDSSGIAEIFSTALASFDPARTGVSYDSSFYTSVGYGTTPSWCGKLTDEIQYITISGCDTTLSIAEMTVELGVVGYDYRLRTLSFACDITAQNFADLYSHSNGNNKTVHVDISTEGTTVSIQLGYLGSVDKSLNKPSNWYQPYVLSTSSAYLQVSLSTLQEGGYLNSHFIYSSKPKLPEIRSLWINDKYTFNFEVSYNGYTYPTYLTAVASQTFNVTYLTEVFNTITVSLISSVVLVQHKGSNWYEYQITFETPSTSTFVPLPFEIQLLSTDISSNIIPFALTTLQTSNNYPIFHNTKVVYGYDNSGLYTCYKREQNYSALTYDTGYLETGVIAEVRGTEYSIGFTSLDSVLNLNLPAVSLINLAGFTVSASVDSVSYAVLDNSGNLNSNNVATLVDSPSDHSWPICGFTYWIFRSQHQIGDCARRQKALLNIMGFYQGTSLTHIANRHGFSLLPQFLVNKIIAELIEFTYCQNSSILAFEEFISYPTPIYTIQVAKAVLQIYLDVYGLKDSTASFSIIAQDDSAAIWNSYITSLDTSVGAFVSFSDKYTKEQYFLSTQEEIIVTPLAHYSIVMVYHLSALPTSVILKLTKEIITGIFLGNGEIIYWNDSLIQQANSLYKSYLPFKRITVVTQSNYSENNVAISRFLSIHNESFRETYGLSIHGNHSIPFSKVLDPDYHIDVGNNLVDNYVSHFDGTIGYHNLLYGIPNSIVSYYCHDPYCNNIVTPGYDSGESLYACQLDETTVVKISDSINSYDLMLSESPYCYPIAGTIDFVTYGQNNSKSCATGKASQRVKFSSWIYDGSLIAIPFSYTYGVAATPAIVRQETYTNLCNIECDYQSLGYQFCSYRNCSWSGDDYYQTVSECDGKTQSRTVTYTLYDNRNCLNKNPIASVQISCAYIPSDSPTGIAAYSIGNIGVAILTILLVITFTYRQEKIIRKSQPIFIYIFIFGSILLCMTINAYIGPNTNFSCLSRPWFFNLSSTIMFAPLLMKLRRIDVLFNNPRLKKITIPDRLVLFQVVGILIIDILLLLVWTYAETPKAESEYKTYTNVMNKVENIVCTTGLSNYMEITLVIYKISLLVAAVYLSIRTWDVSSELSEAKFFAVAIYNIAVVGGIAYFLGDFLIGSVSVSLGVLLQCLGMLAGALVSAIVILTPKLLALQGILKVNPNSSTGSGDEQNGSQQQSQQGSSQLGSSNRSGAPMPVSTTNREKRKKSVPNSKIVVYASQNIDNSKYESNLELVNNEVNDIKETI